MNMLQDKNMYPQALPHSEIKKIFPNVYFVTGTNITKHNNVELQHSRNMIIVRDNNKLSLINTVRLTEQGLVALESLGKVENVVRIGTFHGKDDAFYLDRYNAKLWALSDMKHAHDKVTDVPLLPNAQMPFSDCSLFIFETSSYPECVLHIAKEGGILITCDSIKNWVSADQYFSTETAKLYKEQGLFGAATISKVWKQACAVKSSDFARLKALEFCHLISAHGEPLLHHAHDLVAETIKQAYGI